MSRIRVGGIDVDGSSIHIGEQRMAGPGESAPRRLRPNSDALASAAGLRLPLSPRRLVLFGAGVAVLGATLALVGAVTWAPWPWLVLGIPLCASGLSSTGFGLLVERARGERERLHEAQVAELVSAWRPRLLPLLQEPSPEKTFEWLQSRLEIEELALTRVLDALIRRGEILETIDSTSGNWHYFAVQSSKSIGSRLRELTRRNGR